MDARRGFLTAGHCGPDGTLQSLADSGSNTPLAPLSDAVKAGFTDSAVMWGAPVAADATRLAGTWPVAGVLTEAAARQLPVGTEVCFRGAVSGIKCAPTIRTGGAFLSIDREALHGDSGSVAFLVDGSTRAATLVGTVSGINRGNTYITYLDPDLTRLNATALVDRAAASRVAGDPAYSTAVTTQS